MPSTTALLTSFIIFLINPWRVHLILLLKCRNWCLERWNNLTLGPGRSPGGGHRSPLQYPGLENPTDRGAWGATVHGVPKSWTRLKQLSTQAHTQSKSLFPFITELLKGTSCILICLWLDQGKWVRLQSVHGWISNRIATKSCNTPEELQREMMF